MSSKTVANRSARWSLAVWITIWYSTLAIVLVAGTTAYSYWVLTSNLDREDDEFVVSRLEDVGSRLRGDAEGLSSLSTAWASASDEKSPLRILMRVLKVDGTVLVAMPGSNEVAWPRASHRGYLETAGSTGEWRTVTRDGSLASGEAVILQAALDRRQESLFLARYRKQLYLVLFIVAVACIAGGVMLAQRGLRPIRELSSVAARIEANQMEERLDPSKYAAELEQVAVTFNGMLDRLQDSFARLNRFSGDIAHELRTPLHNLRGEVEVALTKGRSADEYRDILGSCLEETIRLSRLVDSLLFLARSDQPQSALNRESLQLDDELRTIQEFYEAAAEEAGVQLLVVEQSNLLISADRTFFQRVVGNLITNALAHTPGGGRVEIRSEVSGEMVKVVVSDTGVGIAADQLPHVFDRLYRGAGNHPNAMGHGLGLSIVKSVVELHDGSVSVTSIPDQGTTVETRWPAVDPREV